MPKPAKGELTWTSEGPVARITLKGRERESYLLASCRRPADAEERRTLLAAVAQRFRRAGVIDTRQARELLKTIAACAPALLPVPLQVAGELAGGLALPGSKSKAPTFRALGEGWTSGNLHKAYPDHVKTKDSTIDAARLKKLCALDVGGVVLGDIPVDEFTLDHAQAAMGKLPTEAKRPATRRAYAQLLARVMALSVYPCRHIPVSPLPRGFLPKVGKAPAYPYLYPDEEARLLEWNDARAVATGVQRERPGVPLCRRVLFGFLAREGCRVGEAAGLTFKDVDLDRGVLTLDANKTNDARAWALDPSVARALSAWKKSRNAGPEDWVFVDGHGRPLTEDSFASMLRSDLLCAGVDRAELHSAGKNRQPIRAHDLRGTFATLHLAGGKTETWVCDRTGWRSSQMVAKYRRAARSAKELGLGSLLPMDRAIPELFAQRLPGRRRARRDSNP
jgi:integrase